MKLGSTVNRVLAGLQAAAGSIVYLQHAVDCAALQEGQKEKPIRFLEKRQVFYPYTRLAKETVPRLFMGYGTQRKYAIPEL